MSDSHGSSQLLGKAMCQINAMPMLELLLNPLNKAKDMGKVIVATITNNKDQGLVDDVKKFGYEIFQGSKGNVLDRYCQAEKLHVPDTVVRIAADFPHLTSGQKSFESVRS